MLLNFETPPSAALSPRSSPRTSRGANPPPHTSENWMCFPSTRDRQREYTNSLFLDSSRADRELSLARLTLLAPPMPVLAAVHGVEPGRRPNPSHSPITLSPASCWTDQSRSFIPQFFKRPERENSFNFFLSCGGSDAVPGVGNTVFSFERKKLSEFVRCLKTMCTRIMKLIEFTEIRSVVEREFTKAVGRLAGEMV